MGLYEQSDNNSFSDYNYEDLDDLADLDKKKRIKRMLDDRLERKRLKEECRDDFDELNGEFDWDEIEK